MRILIAEDDSTSRAMLAAALTKAGYEPVATADGAAAWAELQKPDAPKIAILDWMMPEMDGVEVTRRARAMPTNHPPYILMLTGRSQSAEIVAGLEAGANDYLVKPFNPDELGARVAVGRRMVELQAALLRKMGELQAIIQSNRDGLMMLGNDRRLRTINRPALRLLQLPGDSDKWRGKLMSELLPALPEEAAEMIEAAQARLQTSLEQTPAVPPVELTIGSRAIHWENQPVTVGDIRLGCLFVLRDVTEERAAAKMRAALTHAMVHDLRNPLTAINGATELLRDLINPPADSYEAKMLAIADDGSRNLLALVASILDIGRLESGQMPLFQRPFSVRQLMSDQCIAQSPLAARKGIELSYACPDELPLAWGDDKIIERVLQNLIGNALKFTPENGRVHITALPITANGQPLIQVAVQDSGPGIPPELGGRLFEQFMTGSHPEVGSGLGLAYCRMALEAHNQQIQAENGPEGGAIFTFTLGIAAEDDL
jgi:signal transduction histidine kinase